MLFTQKDLDVYGLIQPDEKKLEKAKSLYEKLDFSSMMTFKGFYMLWGEEIQYLNVKHINSIEEMCSKIKKYERYRKRLVKDGKIKSCLNCNFRKTARHVCLLNLVTYDDFTWFASKHDNDCCENFSRKEIK